MHPIFRTSLSLKTNSRTRTSDPRRTSSSCQFLTSLADAQRVVTVGEEDLVAGGATVERAGVAFLLKHEFPTDGIVFAFSIYANAMTDFRFQVWRRVANSSIDDEFEVVAETRARPTRIRDSHVVSSKLNPMDVLYNHSSGFCFTHSEPHYFSFTWKTSSTTGVL